MMKRKGGTLDEEQEPKRLHSEEEEATIPEGATLVIQQEDGQYATIVHAGDEFDLQGVADDGEMMIHIPEDQMLSQDGTMVIASDQIVSSEQGVEENDIDQSQINVMGELPLEDDVQQHIKVEQLTVDQLTEAAEGSTEGLAITAEGDELLQYQNLIIQHMDIAEPLTKLRKLLEARLQTSLSQHEFWLQDTIPLDPTKNLVSQCVQGSGLVQINVEVKSQSGPGLSPRLNIVDILKPAEEIVEMESAEQAQAAPAPPASTSSAGTKVVIPFPEESENVTRWIVDQNFRKEQERLKIPFDPNQWNIAHVKHWLQWAIKEFSLVGVNLANFNLTGQQLCSLRHDQFVKYIPNDKGDLFWTHLELLRKCKFVAVIQQPTPHAITTITVSTSDTGKGRNKSFIRKPRNITIPSDRLHPGNRTGNNGQIQLWQFLLELLTDKNFRDIIHWLGEDGEFKLSNPELVAQLWGQRKNKPSMNYEKLSRALRYYYDGDMIAKVHGKRFVYKFVCDLRTLLGYSAGELSRLVAECSAKHKKVNAEMETFASAQTLTTLTGGQTLSPITLTTSLQQLSSSTINSIPSISNISSITGVQPAILKKVFIKQ